MGMGFEKNFYSFPGKNKEEENKEEKNIDFENFKEEDVESLVKKGVNVVLESLDKIDEKYHQDIVKKSLDQSMFSVKDFVKNIDKIKGMDYNKLVNIVVERNDIYPFVSYLHLCSDLDGNLANVLLEKSPTSAGTICSCLDKFKNDVDYNELANKVMDLGFVDDINRNLDKFKNLSDETKKKLEVETEKYEERLDEIGERLDTIDELYG